AEISDGDAAIDRDLAFVGRILSRDQAEQRGLAGAVRADEARLLALLQGGRGFDEDDLVAVLFADGVDADHADGEILQRRKGEVRQGLGHAAPLRKCFLTTRRLACSRCATTMPLTPPPRSASVTAEKSFGGFTHAAYPAFRSDRLGLDRAQHGQKPRVRAARPRAGAGRADPRRARRAGESLSAMRHAVRRLAVRDRTAVGSRRASMPGHLLDAEGRAPARRAD